LRREEELKMKTHRAALVFMLLVLTVAACCANLSGQWQWVFGAPGATKQYTLTLRQDDANLTGTVASEGDSLPIRDGKVSGEKVSFAVARTWGNRETTMTYSGRVVGDEIRLKVSMPGAERSWDVIAKRVP
jgi:hypothetical protein